MPRAGIEFDFNEPDPWDLPEAQIQARDQPGSLFAIYETVALEREIHRLVPPDPLGEKITAAALSTEDGLRHRILRQIFADPRGPKRSLLYGSADMAERVRAVEQSAPHFADVIELIARAVLLSEMSKTPLRLPPILLVGSPGIGKTYVTKQLPQAIGTDTFEIGINIVDSFRLRGLNASWRGAKMGKIAAALLESRTASPVILLDEFDKPARVDSRENPYDVFHTLLEEENAKSFVDDYLEFPLHTENIIWFGSANNVMDLPSSIADRFLIINVPDPSEDHLAAIVDNIYVLANGRYANVFEPALDDEVRAGLMKFNPRWISRLLDLSFAHAASKQRRRLKPSDISYAESTTNFGATRLGVIGFTAK
jgi:ATP-dependent Lon protease